MAQSIGKGTHVAALSCTDVGKEGCHGGLHMPQVCSSAHAGISTSKLPSQQPLCLAAQRGRSPWQFRNPSLARPAQRHLLCWDIAPALGDVFRGNDTVFPGIQTQGQSDPGTPSYCSAPGSSPHRLSELLTNLQRI